MNTRLQGFDGRPSNQCTCLRKRQHEECPGRRNEKEEKTHTHIQPEKREYSHMPRFNETQSGSMKPPKAKISKKPEMQQAGTWIGCAEASRYNGAQREAGITICMSTTNLWRHSRRKTHSVVKLPHLANERNET